MLFSSTRRGARLARLLAVGQLRQWDAPFGLVERAEAVVAELAANAALHGRVPGRSFRLMLVFVPTAGPPVRRHCLLRIEVTDACETRHPPEAVPAPRPGDEAGRGLLLVEALAERWGTEPYFPSGKTVWAEVVDG
ncbi:ATP-binding protein [Streptomyces armeniacus]|uniref:ATP-binding protein n=1 Tax=Streptomyces armeniacus TaxID=83291 RepID=A0A345XVF8_9ACTN|nr:ATP-binding protein [Streptomyces armeniacus]AXK35624.1 ATP-binding protein [Streptomyces armeniacus]